MNISSEEYKKMYEYRSSINQVELKDLVIDGESIPIDEAMVWEFTGLSNWTYLENRLIRQTVSVLVGTKVE